MKLVMEGHTMSDALTSVIKDADLKEAYFHDTSGIESFFDRCTAPQVAEVQFKRVFQQHFKGLLFWLFKGERKREEQRQVFQRI